LNNDVLINSGVEQVRKLVKADNNGVYSFGFYEKVSLPGDSHVASLLRMTNNPQRAEGTHRAEGNIACRKAHIAA